MSSNKIQIIDYTEYSLAVIGEPTREYKEQLKELGGRYGPSLKCGAGWIFSKKLGSKVKSFFLSKKHLIIEYAKFVEEKSIATAKIVSKNSEDGSEEELDQVKPLKLFSSSEDDEDEKPVKVKPTPTISQKEYNEVLRQLEMSKKRESELHSQIETNKKIVEKYNELREKYKRVKKELKIARNLLSGDQSPPLESTEEPEQVVQENPRKDVQILKKVEEEVQDERQEDEEAQEDEDEVKTRRTVCVTM